MTDIGELVVRIKADAAQLEREMKKAQGVVQQSATGMSGSLSTLSNQFKALLPAVTAGTLIAFGKSALSAADRINDLSLRTGFAGSTLSSLNVKLLQTGASLEDFSSSINRMNNMVGEAAKGMSKEAVKAFDDIGLSVKKLQHLSPEDQFFAITEALATVDNQATFTNSGMAIFGRSFSNLAPIIKETKGRLREFSDEQKRLGNALSEEELARIDAWGDRWTSAVEHAKLNVVKLIEKMEYLLDLYHKWLNTDESAKAVDKVAARYGLDRYGRALPKPTLEERAATAEEKSRRLGFATSVTWANTYNEQFGPPIPSAKGSNQDLLTAQTAEQIKKAREALKDYNDELDRQHQYAGMAPRDAAAQKAYYDTMALAQKAGVKNATALAQANAKAALSTYDMAQQQAEATRFAAEIKDQFAETAGSIITNSKNAGDAIKNLANAFAELIAKRYILGPMSDSLFGSGGSGGIFDFGGGPSTGRAVGQAYAGSGYEGSYSGGGGLLSSIGDWFGGFFADGGSPPMGRVSVVGEDGPELFVPKTPGTIVPNSKLGASSVVVHQTFNVSPGVPELINAKMREVIPLAAGAAHASVFNAMQGGGAESRITGLRA